MTQPTPQDKAKELFQKYKTTLASHFMIRKQLDSYAKQCAIIAVDEILNTLAWPPVESTFQPSATYKATLDYWQSVKEEIKKL